MLLANGPGVLECLVNDNCRCIIRTNFLRRSHCDNDLKILDLGYDYKSGTIDNYTMITKSIATYWAYLSPDEVYMGSRNYWPRRNLFAHTQQLNIAHSGVTPWNGLVDFIYPKPGMETLQTKYITKRLIIFRHQ